jgi:hypothetical protein
MPRGSTAKTIKQHKAEGTYRKDRHGAEDAPTPPAATDFGAPTDLPAELVPTWDTVISDLREIGTVTRTDLSLLGAAFVQLKNAAKIQRAFDDVLAEDVPNPSNVSKYQSALASAHGAYAKLRDQVERAVKLRPSKKSGDWLEDL